MGPLRPSTAPAIPYTPVVPATILCAADLDASEARWGFSIPDHPMGLRQKAPKGLYAAFSSWMYSEQAQTVVAGLHWGDYALNGLPLKTVPHQDLGNRQ